MNFQLLTFHFQLKYKDHLGNNRLSYTLDPETNQIKILEENHYYPFGLKHGAYNQTRKGVKYKEQAVSKKEVKQVVPEAVKFKYYYQEQERQDELGLNWDAFKYRNYDYAIGRFMSVDPLAEKYPYNATYAFQENKLGLGRELEGLELEYADWTTAALEGFSEMFRAGGRMLDNIALRFKSVLSFSTPTSTQNNNVANAKNVTEMKVETGTNFEGFFTPNSFNQPSSDPFFVNTSVDNYVETTATATIPTNIGPIDVNTTQRTNTSDNSDINSLKVSKSLTSNVSVYAEIKNSDSQTTLSEGVSNENSFTILNYQIKLQFSMFFQQNFNLNIFDTSSSNQPADNNQSNDNNTNQE